MSAFPAALPMLADPALLLARLVVGLMFLLSGWFKLTDADRREKMRTSLEEAGIPAPGTMTPIVSSVELLAGLGLVLGAATAVSAGALFIVTLVAFLTTTWKGLEGEGIHKLENALYSPEMVMLAGLAVMVAVGPGAASIDAVLR